MRMWVQVRGHDEDVEFSGAATYQLHGSGVLRIDAGNDIHLYSPSYWEEVVIDTRCPDQHELFQEVDTDLQWQ